MDLSKWLGLVFAVVLVGSATLLMVRSWRARQRRDAGVQLSGDAIALGAVRFSGEVLHVATTPAERPLERLAAKPLDFRARGVLSVGEAGVHWRGPAGAELWIESGRIAGADTASWTIDRAVESDGLLRLRFRSRDAGAVEIDSYFRAATPAEAIALQAALETFTSTTPSTGAS